MKSGKLLSLRVSEVLIMTMQKCSMVSEKIKKYLYMQMHKKNECRPIKIMYFQDHVI